MIFDTHAHYNDSAFDTDRDQVLSELADRGVGKVVNVASDLDSIDEVLELARKYDFCYAALGIHPSDCAPLTEAFFADIRKKLTQQKVVAVGEIGLDYHYSEPEKDLQQYWFRKQLQMAKEAGLPVIIHSRDAAEDTLRIMKEEADERLRGVIHCFSYSKEMAMEYIRMGFFLGIGGVVTYKNGRKLKEVVEAVPLDSLVLETDCPYLSPVPHRGERNWSGNLPLVAEEIASLQGISLQEVIDRTARNAEKLYNL